MIGTHTPSERSRRHVSNPSTSGSIRSSTIASGGRAETAIQTLAAAGSIGAQDRVVLFNTGGALKYLDVLD